MMALYCLYTSRWPSGIRYTFIAGNRRCRFSGGSAEPHHHQPDAHRTCRLAAGLFQSCAVAASTRTGGCSQPRATGYDKHLVAGRRCPERSSQTAACGAIFGRRLGDVGASQKHMCLSDLKGSSAMDIDSYAGVLQSTPEGAWQSSSCSTLPGLHRRTFLSDVKPCELVCGRHWVMLSWRC